MEVQAFGLVYKRILKSGSGKTLLPKLIGRLLPFFSIQLSLAAISSLLGDGGSLQQLSIVGARVYLARS